MFIGHLKSHKTTTPTCYPRYALLFYYVPRAKFMLFISAMCVSVRTWVLTQRKMRSVGDL